MSAPAILQLTISRDGTAYETPPDRCEVTKSERNGIFTRLFPRSYFPELKAIAVLSLPLILTQLSQYTAGTVALMFCGRLGEVELAAATMANTLINVIGLSIAVGLATACDTLFSQIYGSKHRKKLGIVFIRSMIFIPLCVLPALAVHLNATNVLLLIGQDAQVAILAADYLLIFIPGLVAFFVYIPMTKFLQHQNLIMPPMIIGLIANVINIVLHFVLVIYLEYGLRGSAVSQMVSFLSFPCLTISYIMRFKVYKDTWTGWSTDCLMDWSQFFWLGWFGLLMVCIEWWSYEIGLIMAGILGTTELDAQAIVMQVSTFVYMPPLGVAVAANIRIGQFLGSDDSLGAITCYRVALSVVWIMSMTSAILICALRYQLPWFITDVTGVIELAARVLPWYSLVCLSEGTISVCGGILRGSGRQNIGAIVTFASYVVGLGIGLPVMMKTQTVQGFWIGMAAALGMEAVIYIVITVRTNWNKQALKALERVCIATKLKMDDNQNYTGEDNDEHEPLIPQEKSTKSHWLYIRRGLTILFFVSTLIIGVLCRIFIPPMVSGDTSEIGNITNIHEPWVP